jgi:hypothetical protein
MVNMDDLNILLGKVDRIVGTLEPFLYLLGGPF